MTAIEELEYWLPGGAADKCDDRGISGNTAEEAVRALREVRDLRLYVESLRDDLKKAAELLQTYAREEATDNCTCCGGNPRYGDHANGNTECEIGNLIKRIETT